MIRVFLVMGSAAKTPKPCSFERRRTIFGNFTGFGIHQRVHRRAALALSSRREPECDGARSGVGCGGRGRHRLPASRPAWPAERRLPGVRGEPAQASDAQEPRRRGVDLLGELRRGPRRRRRDQSGDRRRPGAMALLSTQSSTKAYRSVRGTSARLDALVGDGGLLVVAPDPTVCFTGSTYRQAQHVDLSGTGALVLVDWLSSGRRAAGERWAFDSYSSRASVRVDGRLVFYDGLTLDSTAGDLAERMGRFNVLATVLIVGSVARICGGYVAGGSRGGAARASRGCARFGGPARRPWARAANRRHVDRAGRPDHPRSTSASCRRALATTRGRANGDRSRIPIGRRGLTCISLPESSTSSFSTRPASWRRSGSRAACA